MKKLNKDDVNNRLTESGRTVRLVGEYVNGHTHSEFLCLVCDWEWNAQPYSVLSGKGCPCCGGTQKLTFEDVNKRLEDDNRTVRLIGEYTNVSTPTDFLCLDCDYVWTSTVRSVLLLKCGCLRCSNMVRLTKDIVNDRLIESGRSIRLVGEFKNNKHDTEFLCLECDFVFSARPDNVLHNCSGCPKCAKLLPLTFEEINNRLIESGKSVRLISEYVNARTKCEFECLDCGHQWFTKSNDVLNKDSGCPCCARTGFDPTKPAIVYYVKFINTDAYKIGITNLTVKERFGKHFKNIIVLKEIFFDNGKEAYDFEQFILKEYREHKYTGEPLLKRGNTEILTKDILNDVLTIYEDWCTIEHNAEMV